MTAMRSPPTHTPPISTAGDSAHRQSPPASGPSRSSSPRRAQRGSFRRADTSTGVRRAYLPTYFSLLSLHLPRVQTRIASGIGGLLLLLLTPQALNGTSISPNKSLALHPFVVPASQRTRVTQRGREERNLV